MPETELHPTSGGDRVEHPLWGRGNRFIEHVVAPTQVRGAMTIC